MIDLGDVVPLSVTIRNAEGELANAGEVKVTITLPDLTAVTSGPITPTSLGVYDYDYATVQAGRHGVRWVATGANAAVFTNAFVVEPSDPDAFISLADVNKFLKRPLDDPDVREWIGPACSMIRDRMGHVSPQRFVEDHFKRCEPVILRERPIIEIESVQRLPGLEVVPQADPAAGAAGWIREPDSPILSHYSSSWLGPVRVTYRAGRTPVPANFTLAGRELAGHLWRNSQLNAGGGRPPLSDGDTPVMTGAAFALPIRVRELLGIGKDMFGDEVLIA